MFTSRFKFSLENNRWAKALNAARESGQKLIDLAISNPTRAGFEWENETLSKIFAGIKISNYDPNPRGNKIIRESIAEFYLKEHGAEIDADFIHLSASTSEAYSWLLKLLCDPGDNIVMPTPSYPLIAFLCNMECVETQTYNLNYSEKTEFWELDFESLKSAINEKTRAIFCVNPNNPTGSSFSLAEREQLLALARERNLPLVVDEVFLEYPQKDKKIKTFATSLDAPVFVLGGLSKTAALPQIKAAWILTCGNKEFKENASARLDFIADTFLSISTPAQNVIPIILNAAGTVRSQIIKRLNANEDALQKWASQSIHSLKFLKREAGWYGLIRLPKGVNEESLVVDLLRREQVLVHPGYFYDLEATPAPHLVFSLLAPENDFINAFSKIENALLRN